MSQALHDLAGREFVTALVVTSVGIVVLLLATRFSDTRPPLLGVVAGAGALAGLWRGGLAPWPLDDAGAAWVTPAVLLAVSGSGWLVARFDRHVPGAPALLAVSAAGLYATVPDTEAALALLGAAVPLGLAGLPPSRYRLGYTGAFVWCALLGWGAASGGVGRHGALAAALFLPGLPALTAARRFQNRGGERGVGWVFLAFQVVVALFIARVAGRVSSGLAGALLAGVVVVVAAIAAWWVSGRGARRPPQSS